MKSIIFTSLLFLFSATALGQSQDSTADQQKKHKMDRFIDADGDGICDKRAQGLGFGRRKKGGEKNHMDASSASQRTGKQYRRGRK